MKEGQQKWIASEDNLILNGTDIDVLEKILPHRTRRAIQGRKTKLNKIPGFDRHLLSKREVEIIELISHGHNNVAIGKILDISYRTIETHRRSMIKITGAKNSAHLLRLCFQEGIISLQETWNEKQEL